MVIITLPASAMENDINCGLTSCLRNGNTIAAPIHVDAPAIVEKYNGFQ